MAPEILVAIIAFLGTVLSSIFTEGAKKWFAKRKGDPLKQALDVSGKVAERLSEIQNRYGASKIQLSQFHNGGTFYPTGKSIQKFSVFYELCNPGVAPTRQMNKDVPVHVYYKAIETLRTDGHLEISDFSNPMEPKYGMESVAYLYNTRSLYMFAICNIDHRLIGMITLEYNNVPKVLTPNEINTIKFESALIGGILMNHLTSK